MASADSKPAPDRAEFKHVQLDFTVLLADSLDATSRAKLVALRTETDGFRVDGREIYWWRRKKPGTSLYATVPLAKVLREPFTIRSTNTIRRLVAKWQQSH